MNSDPRQALREGSMTSFQVVVVVICVVLNMVDGFDVLAMSFTAPLVAREWGVDPATLGVLLAAGLVGMGTGAIFISPIADVMGRRAVVILSTVIMSLGMFASAATSNVPELWVCRFVTGLGIGGVLASGNTLLAEYSPTRWRDFTISMMVIGYPTGAIIGGSVFAYLVSEYGWRSAFLFGGAASTADAAVHHPLSARVARLHPGAPSRERAHPGQQRAAPSRQSAAYRLPEHFTRRGRDQSRRRRDRAALPQGHGADDAVLFHADVQLLLRAVLDAEESCRSRLHGGAGHLRAADDQPRRHRRRTPMRLWHATDQCPPAHIVDAGRFVLLHRGVRHDTNRRPADDDAGVPRGPRPDGRDGRPLHHRAPCLSAECAQHGHGPRHRYRPDRRDGRPADRRHSDRGGMGACRLLQRAGAPRADLGARRALRRLFQRAGGACRRARLRGTANSPACVRSTEQ